MSSAIPSAFKTFSVLFFYQIQAKRNSISIYKSPTIIHLTLQKKLQNFVNNYGIFRISTNFIHGNHI